MKLCRSILCLAFAGAVLGGSVAAHAQEQGDGGEPEAAEQAAPKRCKFPTRYRKCMSGCHLGCRGAKARRGCLGSCWGNCWKTFCD